MSEALVLRVPREAPSGNTLRRQYRHWAAYARLVELWEQELLVALSAWLDGNGWRRPAWIGGPVTVQVTRSYATRKLDDDGAQAGLKPVYDALTAPRGRKRYGLSLLVDDSPRWATLLPPVQVKSPTPFVSVRITTRAGQ